MKKLLKSVFLCGITVCLFLIVAFLTSCSKSKNYNAILYDNAVEWINADFADSHRVAGALYTDAQQNGENFPRSRFFIVDSRTAAEGIFGDSFDLEVDYENEMLVVYTFSIEYILPAYIDSISLNGTTLTVNCKIKHIQGAGTACQPYQRWFIVKLDKLDIDSVVFGKIS